MIVCLYGQDDYRRTKEKRAIVEKFVAKHSPLGVKVFDFVSPKVHGTEADSLINALKEFSRNVGLFDSHRLAVIESAWEAPEKEFKEWLESVKDVKTVTVVISEHDALVKNFAFLKKKPVLAKEFDALEGAAWAKFIATEADARGIVLESQALQFLAQAYAGDSWRLVTELDRCSLLGKKTIERKDLESLDIEIQPEFFGLARQFGYGDRKARLAALEVLFLTRDPAAKIFNILSAMVPGAIPRFAAYDVAIKSGKLDYEEALTDLALS